MTSHPSGRNRVAAIERALAAEIPGYTAEAATRNWAELGLDSFDLMTVRAACETAAGFDLPDIDWVEAETPAALLQLAARYAEGAVVGTAEGFTLFETVELGMPQMAMGGLSENWLFRTLGDLHWRLIAQTLGTRPRDICDARGERLYPTFNRIAVRSSLPLADYGEGEQLAMRASLSHFGPGLFFSECEITGSAGARIEARLMSSFTSRSAPDSNTDLQRGQPVLPATSQARALEAMPEFGLEYRALRQERDAPREPLARTAYEIQPVYDINGVGLLYCAAYPMISDLCEMRALDRDAATTMRLSTVARDVCYFANADPGAALEWRLHRDAEELETESSIVRGDGAVMARVVTERARV